MHACIYAHYIVLVCIIAKVAKFFKEKIGPSRTYFSDYRQKRVELVELLLETKSWRIAWHEMNNKHQCMTLYRSHFEQILARLSNSIKLNTTVLIRAVNGNYVKLWAYNYRQYYNSWRILTQKISWLKTFKCWEIFLLINVGKSLMIF